MPPSQRHPPGVNPYAPSSSKAPAKSRPGGSKAPVQQVPVAKMHISEDATVEDFGPPDWRTVMHSRIDFGYPDFYPSRPGFDQLEDVLTETNVKTGFVGKPFVSEVAETFSMHGPIHQHLSSGCLNMLMQLGKEMVEKQEEFMPQFGERSFRIPVRVTYNDTKRIQFLSDLSNPSVPLHRLMRTPVPHGYKGVELLDAMFSPATSFRQPATNSQLPTDPIPVGRAIWFIRVVGANEISAHRGRQTTSTSSVAAPSPVAATPSSSTTAGNGPLPVASNDWYSQEFTNTFIQWMRTQLGQLTLPSSARSQRKTGLTAPKGGAGVLQDEKARTKWLTKWTYSATLLRELHTRHLLSSRLLTSWLADYLSQANLAQLGFIAQLIGEYMSDIVNHLENARHCMRAVCEKLAEVRESPGKDVLGNVEAMLVSIIKTLYEANSDVLLSPVTWRQYSSLLSTIIPSANSQWADLQRRNEALMFKPAVSEATCNPRRQQMEEIQKLDSICEDTNMTDITCLYFDGTSLPTSSSPDLHKVEEKIFTLLNWSMGLFKLGAHRPYAVYTILKNWHEQHEETQTRQAKPHVVDLFEILYKWLDTARAAKNEDNVEAIGITIGELTRRGMFSYGRYLQTLIANGETTRGRAPGGKPSHHLALLRVMPIFVVAKDLLQQRRIALSGDDAEIRRRDDAEEEAMLTAFREEVMEYVPEVFELKSYGRSEELKTILHHQLPTSSRLSRHLYVYARFSIAAKAGQTLKSRDGQPAMDASTFARLSEVFRQSKGYATIADFMIRALHEAEDDEIIDVILDIVRRDADIWTSMDLWPRLGDKLLDRHHMLESRGQHHPRLLAFLKMLAQKRRLTAEDEDEVRHLPASIVKSTSASRAIQPLPQGPLETLPHVLTTGKDSIALSIASDLHNQYGSFSLWSLKWWTVIVAVIRDSKTEQKQHLYNVTRAHLVAVFKECQSSFDSVVASWLSSLAPASLMRLFSDRSSDLITSVLIFLVSQRALSTMTLLTKAVFPIWKSALESALLPHKSIPSKQAQAIVSTVRILSQLLVSPPLNSELPPFTLTEGLVVQASRQSIFQGDNVTQLIQHLPILVVFEQSKLLPKDTSMRIGEILTCLAMTAEFKTAAFRNLNILKDAFLSPEWSKPGVDQGLEAKMVDVLKLIMSEKPAHSSPKSAIQKFDTSSRFSAWRWTRIVLEMRVEFKALAMIIAEGQEAGAKRQLNRLVHDTLDRETSVDDTDLLCEVFKGLDATIIQEILAAGMERLATLLGQCIGAETQQQLETSIKSIDQILRILDSTKHNPSQHISEPSILNARHKLLDLVAVALQTAERYLLTGHDLVLPHGISPPQPSYLLNTVMGLLRFTLGIEGIDNGGITPKPNFPHLATCFFRAIVACGTILDTKSGSEMGDMLAYIIDCTPPQSRLACQAALLEENMSHQSYSAINIVHTLSSALPYSSPLLRHMSLTTPETSDDSHESPLPLDERRWELFEYMAPIKSKPGPQNLFLSSTPLKDSSSIPIGLFSPRVTRDAAPGAGSTFTRQVPSTVTLPTSSPENSYQNFASERNIGDGFAGEPSWVKQAVTQAYSAHEAADDVTIRKESNGEVATSPQAPKTKKSAGRKEPALKGSHQDPVIIIEDADDGGESDPEAPLAKKQRTGGKVAAASANSNKAAVKDPARKTTGGKGTRKASGGKSAKESAGTKAKSGGRRRSTAEQK